MTTRCPEPEDLLAASSTAQRGRPAASLQAHLDSCPTCRQTRRELEETMLRIQGLRASGTTEGPGCLDLETLAALVDGALSPDRREQALRHVADCERCSAEVASLARALKDPTLRQEIRRLETPPLKRPWVLGLAGVAAAGLAFVLVTRLAPPGSRKTEGSEAARLLARAVPKGSITLPPGWSDLGWSEVRGGVGAAATRQVSFRVGVRLLDLHYAVTSGDLRQARQRAGELDLLLRALPFAEPARTALGDLVDAMGREALDSALAFRLHEVEDVAQRVADSAFVSLGLRIEAARLAAQAGTLGALGAPELRAALQALRDAGVAARESGRLAALLGENLNPADLPEIRRLLDEIARIAGG
jgi:hypothetical protein